LITKMVNEFNKVNLQSTQQTNGQVLVSMEA
jgi:hypothetical protein